MVSPLFQRKRTPRKGRSRSGTLYFKGKEKHPDGNISYGRSKDRGGHGKAKYKKKRLNPLRQRMKVNGAPIEGEK